MTDDELLAENVAIVLRGDDWFAVPADGGGGQIGPYATRDAARDASIAAVMAARMPVFRLEPTGSFTLLGCVSYRIYRGEMSNGWPCSVQVPVDVDSKWTAGLEIKLARTEPK